MWPFKEKKKYRLRIDPPENLTAEELFSVLRVYKFIDDYVTVHGVNEEIYKYAKKNMYNFKVTLIEEK